MKFRLSLKNKEVNVEAGIEGLVEKQLEYKAKHPNPTRKTRYQIRQEEKRKNRLLEHRLEQCLGGAYVRISAVRRRFFGRFEFFRGRLGLSKKYF